MWDRWVSGCVEMGLPWNRGMGGQGHPFPITAPGQRGQSWSCFLVLSFTAIHHKSSQKSSKRKDFVANANLNVSYLISLSKSFKMVNIECIFSV